MLFSFVCLFAMSILFVAVCMVCVFGVCCVFLLLVCCLKLRGCLFCVTH